MILFFEKKFRIVELFLSTCHTCTYMCIKVSYCMYFVQKVVRSKRLQSLHPSILQTPCSVHSAVVVTSHNGRWAQTKKSTSKPKPKPKRTDPSVRVPHLSLTILSYFLSFLPFFFFFFFFSLSPIFSSSPSFLR